MYLRREDMIRFDLPLERGPPAGPCLDECWASGPCLYVHVSDGNVKGCECESLKSQYLGHSFFLCVNLSQ